MGGVFWAEPGPTNVRTGKRIPRRLPRDADREAFHTESLALYGSVYNTALRLTKNPADAEDLAQETYARALGASGRFERGTNLKGWLFTILRNINRNRKRDQARAIVIVDGEAVDRSDGADAREAPEARLLREASSRELRAAIASLPRRLGQTVWLRDIEGLSYAEIAERLHVPIGTVMSRLSSARELLYRRLTGTSRGRWHRWR